MHAIHVEQNMIKEKVGSQDQTAVAFGGLNQIKFGGSQEITVQPVIMPFDRVKELQDCLLLFFTELPREKASKIAAEQIKKIPSKTAELTAMHQTVNEGLNILQSNRDLDEFGRLLNTTWKIKRTLSPKITNSKIDAIYRAGRQAGVLGGKLLGAGGGGFMLFYARPEQHAAIRELFKRFIFVPVHFEFTGSQIIYFSPHTGL
jgi:D-glycero-alpha-D-manno-heptose-7-phosphate kinase